MGKSEDETPRRTDVATSAVIREAMSSIVREMRRAMVQSSYSSIIYDGYDFSCVLIDGKGRLVAESGEDHPF
ncbi:hydantoinase B/oxoprolinase family protein, partial [Mycobacterium kansasii]